MTDIFQSLSNTVVFLFAGDPPVPIGTAFTVGYPSTDDDALVIPLIVSAKHVTGERDKVLARYSTADGTTTAFAQYDLAKQRTSNDYWEHPDAGVDIVVFRTAVFPQVKYDPLPINLIATKRTFVQEDIKQTDRVVFPALLANFMGTSKNYPVMRDGTIAVLPEDLVPLTYDVGAKEISTSQQLIFLDATSIPGASGAPIFLWPGPRIKGSSFTVGGTQPHLIGVMHGFYPAVPRGLVKQVVASDGGGMFEENSGIALAFPSWRLREILESDPLKARMDELVGKAADT